MVSPPSENKKVYADPSFCCVSCVQRRPVDRTNKRRFVRLVVRYIFGICHVEACSGGVLDRLITPRHAPKPQRGDAESLTEKIY
jgi:hypothetical protein